MCSIDECEPAEFWCESFPVAMKPHACSECGGSIQRGEQYSRATTKWGDTLACIKTCACCAELGRWFSVVCGGWPIGGLHHEIAYHSDEYAYSEDAPDAMLHDLDHGVQIKWKGWTPSKVRTTVESSPMFQNHKGGTPGRPSDWPSEWQTLELLAA